MLISAVPYLVVLGLRHAFAIDDHPRVQLIAIGELPGIISQAFRRPNPYTPPFLVAASIAPLVLLARHVHSRLGAGERGLLLASYMILAITLVFGNAGEMRVYLPAFAVAVYALTLAGQKTCA